MSDYHVPVLLEECLDALDIKEIGTYVDVTFGGGGHSNKILEQLNEKGNLIGFDQDADAAKNVPDDARFHFAHSNYKYLKQFLRLYGFRKVDGILAMYHDQGLVPFKLLSFGAGVNFMQNRVA